MHTSRGFINLHQSTRRIWWWPITTQRLTFFLLIPVYLILFDYSNNHEGWFIGVYSIYFTVQHTKYSLSLISSCLSNTGSAMTEINFHWIKPQQLESSSGKQWFRFTRVESFCVPHLRAVKFFILVVDRHTYGKNDILVKD